jgi:ADP-ribose pyrophosphatase
MDSEDTKAATSETPASEPALEAASVVKPKTVEAGRPPAKKAAKKAAPAPAVKKKKPAKAKPVAKAESVPTAKAASPAPAVKKVKKTKTKPAPQTNAEKTVKAEPKKAKLAKAKPEKVKLEAVKSEKVRPKNAKPAKVKPAKTKPVPSQTAEILDSQVAFEGPLFRVLRDHIIEPGGRESYRDVIRHNGSVVILATNPGKRKKDPWVVIERQYRHAAGQFLWELPAGKLDGGEQPIDGAKRELAEETGYSAKKWSPLVEYYASPGFLGESMKVFLAEGLIAGDAHPEEDEHIDFRLVKLSELLEMVDKGKIIDGKTLTSILLYARQLGLKRRK